MTLVSEKNEVRPDGAAAAPSPRRPARKFRLRLNLRGLAFAVGLVLVLEAVTAWYVKSAYVPRPSEVFAALYAELLRGDLVRDAGQTLQTFALGLLFAAVAAVVSGVVLGSSPRIFSAFKLIIEFLRPLPSVALIPFAILILGVGGTTGVAMTAYAAFWPILFNTYYGVRDADPVAVDTARNFGLSRPAVLRRVLLPSAATNIAAGIRISAAIALVLAITVEIITSSGGLGYYIVRMQTATRTEDMYAGVFAVGILGYVINLVVAALERKVVFWKTDVRDGGAR
jgi:NitT/TauT family transport system permease protein